MGMGRLWLLLLAAGCGSSVSSEDTTTIQSNRSIEIPSLRGRQLKQPVNLQILCGLDVTGAVGAIGQVGTAAQFVHRNCAKTDKSEEKAACSTAVSALVARTLFLATFLTSAAATCADTFNVPVFCAHASFELTGSLGLVSTAASAFQLSCGTNQSLGSGPIAPAVRRLANSSGQKVALLPAASRDVLSSELVAKVRARLQKQRDRKAELADCVFTSLVLSQFAVRGGVLISGAAKSCEAPQENKATCLTDVSGVLASFSVTGALIALVTSECPVARNFKALCATDVLTMVSAIGFLVESVGKMLLNCGVPGAKVDELVAQDDALAGYVFNT